MTIATIIQEVNCVFGHDHKVTMKIDEKGNLVYIGCDCYNHKKEVEGLILLGTDSMNTCLGIMKYFLEKVNKTHTPYSWVNHPRPFTATVFPDIYAKVSSTILAKRSERVSLKQEMMTLREESDVICRQLRKFMLHYVTKPQAAHFSFFRVGDSTYDFCIKTNRDKSRNTNNQPLPESVTLASRIGGIWWLVPNWENLAEQLMTIRQCVFCGKYGHQDHSKTAQHKRALNKVIMLALQSTSAPGISHILQNAKKSEDEMTIGMKYIKYRKGSRNLVGVKLPKETKSK